MTDLTLILLSAGESSRFGIPVKKQWLRVGREPLWLYVLKRFQKMNRFDKIIVTAHKNEVELFRRFTDIEVVEGGNSRQESIKKSLDYTASEYVIVSDIARSCVPDEVIDRVISAKESGDVVYPSLRVSDTALLSGETVDRDLLELVQTPQLSKRDILKDLLNRATEEFTDESSLFHSYDYKRVAVAGDKRAEKLTFGESIESLKCLKDASTASVVGNGFDVHQLESTSSPLMLGGVEIESPLSFKAHSDGDVLIHSLIDAILGGAGAGDIGELFPDSDEKYKGADSRELLKEVVQLIQKIGLKIEHIDITVMAEKPRLKLYKREIERSLADIIGVELYAVNIKATTTEKLGFIGRAEGVAVFSTVTLGYFNWREYL